MKQKKVLVLGATGAMARYMIPYLAENGYQVDGVALNTMESTDPRSNTIRATRKT